MQKFQGEKNVSVTFRFISLHCIQVSNIFHFVSHRNFEFNVTFYIFCGVAIFPFIRSSTSVSRLISWLGYDVIVLTLSLSTSHAIAELNLELTDVNWHNASWRMDERLYTTGIRVHAAQMHVHNHL